MAYYAVTALLVAISFLLNRKKTIRALSIAWNRFWKLLPLFLVMLVAVSIALTLLPENTISHLLGVDNPRWGLILAIAAGSISIMPGFIAFPLCSILHGHGIPYMVLSAFTTTLMMVGIVTLPVEKAYFGLKTALMRNAISLVTALIVALITGLAFGELKLL